MACFALWRKGWDSIAAPAAEQAAGHLLSGCAPGFNVGHLLSSDARAPPISPCSSHYDGPPMLVPPHSGPTTLVPERRLIAAASTGARQVSGCGSVRRWRLKPPSTARHWQRACPRPPAGRRRGRGDAENVISRPRVRQRSRRHAIMDTQARPMTGWPPPGQIVSTRRRRALLCL